MTDALFLGCAVSQALTSILIISPARRPGWLALSLLVSGLSVTVAMSGFSLYASVGWLACQAVGAVIIMRGAALSGLGNILQGSTLIAVGLATLVWQFIFAATAEVGALTATMLWIISILGLLQFPSAMLEMLLYYDVFWQHGSDRCQPAARGVGAPMVSVHVCSYAEPPELVIATLDALSRLTYPAFEVLVIDNNTKDEALWRPVERHCLLLGPRFRFFHINQLPGGKPAALNFGLAQTSADADLIALVDADYIVEPDFLDRLEPYLRDPAVAFAQTRHDYRDFADNGFKNATYGEYRILFSTYMKARLRWGSPIAVGTMVLFRREALEKAGGWAEFCVSEDSEIAIRLSANGYRGIYLPITLGRGVMPEAFGDYRKQRYRWTFGPTQEVRRNRRLWRVLPLRQRILYAFHGLRELSFGMGTLLEILAIAVAAFSLAATNSSAAVPWPALVAYGIILSSRGFAWSILLRREVADSTKQAIGAAICRLSLTYARARAGVRGWFTPDMPYYRTAKFKTTASWVRALKGTKAELSVAAALIVTVAAPIAVTGVPGSLFGLMAAVLLIRSVPFALAPVVALYAERWNQRAAREESEMRESTLMRS
jgi:cellulose synthase/poly-beta-1,6-N-acetylglucosamine synthase-like glycosyltransferase